MAGIAALGQGGWQYKPYPSDALRDQRCCEILLDLFHGRIDSIASACDSRQIHQRLFAGMHPIGMEYFAGGYRGTNVGLLAQYPVYFGGRQGTHWSAVANHMRTLGEKVSGQAEKIARMQFADESRRVTAVVATACELMVRFMAIHPYADGNGHMGRYVLWAFLNHFKIHARRWPLNDRPGPKYVEHLENFRSGKKVGLIDFVLAHISLQQPYYGRDGNVVPTIH